jgi:hypothetical protein
MLQRLIDFFFGPKSVDAVLVAFNRAREQLEQVRAAQLDEAGRQRQAIADAQKAHDEATKEADRAAKVAERLSALVDA